MQTNEHAVKAVEEPENLKKHLENLMKYHIEKLRDEEEEIQYA